VELQCFLQVGEGLFFGLPLAGDINFEALRNKPISLAPNGRGKWSLHSLILSQDAPIELSKYYLTSVLVY